MTAASTSETFTSLTPGAYVLWQVLRYAHLNNLVGPKKAALEGFDCASSGANDGPKGPFAEAVRWLAFKRDDALAVGAKGVPHMPEDLARLIRA